MNAFDIKAKLVQGAFKVIESPRCVRLMRDQRVLSRLTAVMSLPAHTRVALHATGRDLARALGLATVEDLRQLELQLGRERAAGARRGAGRRSGGSGGSGGPGPVDAD